MKSGRLVLVAVCLILAPGAPATAVADGATRNIVVLASRDSQQPAYEQFMSGFRAGLNAQPGDRLELFTEFLAGFELFARRVAAGTRPTVTFVTGFDEPEARRRAAERNAAAFLHEPFSGTEFVAAVRGAIGTPPPNHRTH